MTACRFLIDECVSSHLFHGLRLRFPGITVVQVGREGAPPKGTPDPRLLEICERCQWTLVTSDRRTTPTLARKHLLAGGHLWGVFVLHSWMSLSRVIDELAVLHGASDVEDWLDQIHYLPL